MVYKLDLDKAVKNKNLTNRIGYKFFKHSPNSLCKDEHFLHAMGYEWKSCQDVLSSSSIRFLLKKLI